MDWKSKLSSRKFWVAVAGLVVGMIALLGIKTDTSQITGVIMALGSVVAYIVGEGLVDAAAVGSGDAGAGAIQEPFAPIIGTIDPAPAEGTPTGAAKAAEVKQDTALSGDLTLDDIDTQIAAVKKAISEAAPTDNLDMLNKALAALQALRAVYTVNHPSGSKANAPGTAGVE